MLARLSNRRKRNHRPRNLRRDSPYFRVGGVGNPGKTAEFPRYRLFHSLGGVI